MRLLLPVVSVLLVLLACDEGAPSERQTVEEPVVEIDPSMVSRQSLGEAWPLTVGAGRVGCEQDLFAYFEELDGTRWALNGAAQQRYPEIEPIWAVTDSTEFGVTRKNIGVLIDAALDLCDS